MDTSDVAYSEITKMYEAYEEKMKTFEKLVGTGISREGFDSFKQKSLEDCQKHAEKLLLGGGGDSALSGSSSGKSAAEEQIEALQSTIDDLQIELLFNKSLIETLIKKKVDQEVAKVQNISQQNQPGLVSAAPSATQNGMSFVVNSAHTQSSSAMPLSAIPQAFPTAALTTHKSATTAADAGSVLKRCVETINSTTATQTIVLTLQQINTTIASKEMPHLKNVDREKVLQTLIEVIKRTGQDKEVYEWGLTAINTIVNASKQKPFRLTLASEATVLARILEFIIQTKFPMIQLYAMRILDTLIMQSKVNVVATVRRFTPNILSTLEAIVSRMSVSPTQDNVLMAKTLAVYFKPWTAPVKVHAAAAAAAGISTVTPSSTSSQATASGSSAQAIAALTSSTSGAVSSAVPAVASSVIVVASGASQTNNTHKTPAKSSVPVGASSNVVKSNTKSTAISVDTTSTSSIPTTTTPGGAVKTNGTAPAVTGATVATAAAAATPASAAKTPLAKSEKKTAPKTPSAVKKESWYTDPPGKLEKTNVKFTSKGNIHKLIKSPELNTTIAKHMDFITSADASREDKVNAYQFIFDLFQADYPPMEAVDDSKMLEQLITVATKKDIAVDLLESALLSILFILLMTEDSARRVDICVKANLLPFLVQLLDKRSTWGVQHNAIRILNSIAQDSDVHLQAVVAVNPVERVLLIANHADADEDISKQVANILSTLSTVVDLTVYNNGTSATVIAGVASADVASTSTSTATASSTSTASSVGIYDTILSFMMNNRHALALQGCDILNNILTKHTPAGILLGAKTVEMFSKAGGILDFFLKVGIVDPTPAKSGNKAISTSFSSMRSQTSQTSAQKSKSKEGKVLTKEAQQSAIRVFSTLFLRLPADVARTIYEEHNLSETLSAHFRILSISGNVAGCTLEATHALETIFRRLKRDSPAWFTSHILRKDGPFRALSEEAVEYLRDYVYHAKKNQDLKETAERVLELLDIDLFSDDDEEEEEEDEEGGEGVDADAAMTVEMSQGSKEQQQKTDEQVVAKKAKKE